MDLLKTSHTYKDVIGAIVNQFKYVIIIQLLHCTPHYYIVFTTVILKS